MTGICVISSSRSSIKEIVGEIFSPTEVERILIVDDESIIGNLQETILARLGYTVTAITNSREAFEKIRLNPDQFDPVQTT